jgi:hypothetical protein
MMHAIVDYCVDGTLQRELVRAAQEIAPGERLCIELIRDDVGKLDIVGFVKHTAQGALPQLTP